MLYSDVAGARWVGYAISVTSTGAAAAANVSPKPIRNLHINKQMRRGPSRVSRRNELCWGEGHSPYRAPMNMPTECDAVWRTVATHITTAPKTTAVRRPRPSDMYGENGYAARHPMFYVRRFSVQDSHAGPELCKTARTWMALSSPSYERVKLTFKNTRKAHTDLPAAWIIKRGVPLWERLKAILARRQSAGDIPCLKPKDVLIMLPS